MDKEIKEKWVAALRSGQFSQASEALYKDGSYCCLGVLCKVMTGHNPTESDTSDWSEYLAEGLAKKAGLNNEDQKRLARMNDGPGLLNHNNEYGVTRSYSFPEIADYIEKNL